MERDLRRKDGTCRHLRGPCTHFKKCEHGCGECGICHYGKQEPVGGQWVDVCKRPSKGDDDGK